jgi:hypothetical protein
MAFAQLAEPSLQLRPVLPGQIMHAILDDPGNLLIQKAIQAFIEQLVDTPFHHLGQAVPHLFQTGKPLLPLGLPPGLFTPSPSLLIPLSWRAEAPRLLLGPPALAKPPHHLRHVSLELLEVDDAVPVTIQCLEHPLDPLAAPPRARAFLRPAIGFLRKQQPRCHEKDHRNHRPLNPNSLQHGEFSM